MKIEILKENLKNGLSVIERVVGKNPSLPILDNVLINAEDSLLNLNSTDLETAVRLWILTKIVKKGKLSIPAKVFSSLISTLPNEKIILEADGFSAKVECGSFKTQIQGLNPEEFPIIPSFQNLDFISVDCTSFCHGLSQLTGIASYSQSRPEISGICFIFSKNVLKMAATDSFRLAEKKINLDAPVNKDFSFIIPQKPATEIVNILSGKEGKIKIFSSPTQVMFEFSMKETNHPQVQIISRLIDGEYPNYEEIIPQKFKTHAIIKRDEFLDQIKTASIFSGKTSEIKIKIIPSKKEIEIFAQDSDVGESKSIIQTKGEGDPVELAFNYKFLSDGLINIKGSEVMFDVSKEDGPCIIKPVGDASYIYVVMPIKAN